MGYYTFFDLTWDVAEDSDEEQAIIAWLEDDEIRENFEDFYPGGACGMSKWRDDEADMLRLSEAFPRVLFTLSGSGEEETDLWRSYYRAGMVQHAPAEIYYEPFDPGRLRDPEDPEPLPATPQQSSDPRPTSPASNSGANVPRQGHAGTDTNDTEPSFAGIRQTMAEQLDDRTILRLYYGIRYHPSLGNDPDYERPYRDYQAAEAELYNFAAAAGIETPDEAEQLQRCRTILAREIRDGLHLTSYLPNPHANNKLFLAHLDDPESFPQVDV